MVDSVNVEIRYSLRPMT